MEPAMPAPLCCLDGEILPLAEAKVSVSDRGFVFGDSIYEVMRLYSGRMWLEERHYGRLDRSLREMQFTGFDLDRLRTRVAALIAASHEPEATVYIQITRGVAPRLHAFPDPWVPPTELIVVRPYDDTSTAVIRETGVSCVTHPDIRWGRCDVKSTNLLANVLANEFAHRNGAYEAIFIDHNIVTEASHSSLLWVRDGRLEATPNGFEILPGTTRNGLPLPHGLRVHEASINLDELLRAEEVILTGTTIEVLPVVQVDGHVIGNGKPGAITQRLQAAFRDAVATWLEGPEQ
jgi:D-alanine transaminase